MNYYRRYVGDYLRDTSRLSMLEHGAYNLMLDYYYADEKPLPLDKDELYTMVRAMRHEDKRAVDKVLGLYFTRQPDGYHQGRVDEELGVARATIAKQRESGCESAAKRWGKDGSTDGSTHTDTDGSTYKSTHRSTYRSTNTPEDGLQNAYDPSSTDTTTNQNKPPTKTNHQPPTTKKSASRRASQTPLPENFVVSDRVLKWASQHGLAGVIESHLEAFVSTCRAKGYTYVDWDEAFMNAVRKNWAKIEAPRSGPLRVAV